MSVRHISHRILAVVGLSLGAGLLLTALFYARQQENAVRAQHERSLRQLADSVIQGLYSVMLAGHAEAAQAYAERLKAVPDISDFRILRVNGIEAFHDNETIAAVNRRDPEHHFAPRAEELRVEVMDATNPYLRETLGSLEPIAFYDTDRTLTFLAPILNQDACHECHGSEQRVRGVVKLTTTLAPVEGNILRGRQQSLVVAGIALVGTLLLTGYMLTRSVTRPIRRVTEAMSRVAAGDLERKVPALGDDEIARMAHSFNRMTAELAATYTGLRQEQDKLTTVIRAADQGIVVTDGRGTVVLVNPAATELLGKSADTVMRQGFLSLFDAPGDMQRWLDEGPGAPVTITYKQRVLNLAVATIRDARGVPLGSAAMFRNVTEETRLQEELRRLSNTDPLTGLHNRRYLDETLGREFERARRHGLPLSVMMCDVDNFKQFNDRYGHERGDRVLQTVAEMLGAALRGHDFPCRYGGEEFLAVLPSTPQSGAYSVAERLRRDIVDTSVEGLKVTVSIGVASFPEVAATTPRALIEAADRALYDAKQAGRNRVRVAPPRSVG